jgi:hypothetical protein
VLASPGELWFSVGGHLLCLDVSVRDRCAVAGLVTTPTRDRSPASGCGLPAANKK